MNYNPNRGNFRQASAYGNSQQPRQNREGAGKLWPNTRSQNPKAPQFTGVCTLNGIEYFISAWYQHDPQKGDTFSLKLEPKQQQRRDNFEQNGGYSGYAPNQPQQRSYAPQQATNNYGNGPQNGNAYMAQRQPNTGYSPPQSPSRTSYAQVEPPPANSPDEYGNADPFNDDMPF